MCKSGDRTRLDNHLVPEPTSLLAQDDAGSWQKLLLSQHVWSALASTYDHLDLFRSTVHARKIYPTATYSLLRGGLLGACQAMWLLEPEEAAERQERGRRYSEEWYVKRIQWQQTFLPSAGASRKSGLVYAPQLEAHEAGRVASQLELLKSDLELLRMARTSSATYNSTAIIERVAEVVFPDDLHARRSLVREWRRLGGDAHVLGWSLMTQETSWGTLDEDGKTSATVQGSLASLGNSYFSVWLVYRRAWQRLDELLVPTRA